MESYLKKQKTCVKIGSFSNNWQNMLKGVLPRDQY